MEKSYEDDGDDDELDNGGGNGEVYGPFSCRGSTPQVSLVRCDVMQAGRAMPKPMRTSKQGG